MIIFKRIINLIENYKKKEFYKFKKYNCVERANLRLISIYSNIPISQFEIIISLMRGLEILSEYQSSATYKGYIFNEEKYKLFKVEQNEY